MEQPSLTDLLRLATPESQRAVYRFLTWCLSVERGRYGRFEAVGADRHVTRIQITESILPGDY